MRILKTILPSILITACTLAGLPAGASAFGKNKIQYSDHDWSYVRSPHFDVYFYGDKSLAFFAADTAESTYVDLKEDFQYELQSRIPIVAYNSHNDFEGTNVTPEIPDESVGGFTEFFKNRVVVPFQGSYQEFRHVIRHEMTHALMMQMLYGSTVGSVVYGLARFSLPLWFVEGLAEYESLTWDSESDAWMRDAVAGGYLPQIDGLNGYLAYKGGQSVFEYISRRYGRQKIGELLRAVRETRSVDGAFLQSIGLKTDELSKRWSRYLNGLYGDDIGRRARASDIARRLTNHERLGNGINHSPAISPDGGSVAFLSDRSDYFDIFLSSTYTGEVIEKLVSGQKSSGLEEFHWLRPGMSWSADGSCLAFAAKSGGRDALYILDVSRKAVVHKYQFDCLDGLFSPAWCPTDSLIAFTGLASGRDDLYVLDLRSGRLRRLTSDRFSDVSPSWSPDGARLAFCSDRGDSLSGVDGVAGMATATRSKSGIDIYVLDVGSGAIERITRTSVQERTPVWSPDGVCLAFTADDNGIFNILVQRLSDGARWTITDVLTGCDHLSWSSDGKSLCFASLANRGYDIYLLPDPLLRQSLRPDSAAFLTSRSDPGTWDQVVADRDCSGAPRRQYLAAGGFSHYSFEDNYFTRRQNSGRAVSSGLADSAAAEDDGRSVRRYTPKFSLDLLDAGAAYSQFFGFQGLSTLGVSDMLGNHQFLLQANVIRRLEDSDYALAYSYLPHRTDCSFAAFHFADFMATSRETIRFRIFGASLGLTYPLDTYNRLSAELSCLGFRRDGLGSLTQSDSKAGVVARSELVHDTVVWGFSGPVNGARYRLSIESSMPAGGFLDYRTITADCRRYLRLGLDQTFALRIAAGTSLGRNASRFLLGGVDNWINNAFGARFPSDRIEDVYLSTVLTPLRGADYYEKTGKSAFLTNLELRFPLVRYFLLGWPLPLGLSNIRGALFSDLGGAWDDVNSFRPTRVISGERRLTDVVWGYGAGMRMEIAFVLMRLDIAWKNDLVTNSRPRYYVSFGMDL